MRLILALIFVGLLAHSAPAQQWYARGEFNGWTTDNPMEDEGGGHWTESVVGLFANTPTPFKIAVADWSINMPSPSNGNNDSRVYTNADGGIKFHLWDNITWNDGWFPNNVRRIGYDDHQQFDWEIVGSFNNFQGPSDPNFYLTDVGNGLHRGEFTFNAGIYDFKFRGLTPVEWDTSIGSNFGNTAPNNSFAVANDGDEVIFELDLPNGRWRTFTDSPPPGTIGNFDGDLDVDGNDFLVWQRGLGTTRTAADLADWRAHFGEIAAPAPWLARSPQLGDQPLVEVGGGEHTLNLTGLTPATDYDFRIVRSDLSETVPGGDMRVRADANGEIDLNLFELEGASWGDGWSPNNTARVGYEDHDQFDWELIGSFNAWPGTADPAYFMTDQGNGLHTGSFVFNTPGAIAFKFREQGSWQTSIGGDFGNTGADNTFTVTSPGELWHFELDLPNGRWCAYLDGGGITAVPEPASILLVMIMGFVACGSARR